VASRRRAAFVVSTLRGSWTVVEHVGATHGAPHHVECLGTVHLNNRKLESSMDLKRRKELPADGEHGVPQHEG
jgi:hypothetical protein